MSKITREEAKGKMYKEIKKVLYNKSMPDIDDKVIDIQYIVGSYLETQQPTITNKQVRKDNVKLQSQLNAIKQVVEGRLFEDYISDVGIKLIQSILKEEEK